VSRVTVISIVVSPPSPLHPGDGAPAQTARRVFHPVAAGSVIILVLSISRTGSSYRPRGGDRLPAVVLFLVGILFILLILIHFSIAISKLYMMNKKMAQEIALMKEGRTTGNPKE